MYESLFTAQGLRVQLDFTAPDADINLGRFETLRAMKDQF